jgi:hypothetical protein
MTGGSGCCCDDTGGCTVIAASSFCCSLVLHRSKIASQRVNEVRVLDAELRALNVERAFNVERALNMSQIDAAELRVFMFCIVFNIRGSWP